MARPPEDRDVAARPGARARPQGCARTAGAGARHERHGGPRLSREPFAERVRELVGDEFRTASSWQEVHASLKGHGLEIQPSRSGRGLVVTDGRHYVAASKVAREASGPHLERRLGAYEPASPDLDRLRDISDRLQKHMRLDNVRDPYVGKLYHLREATSWEALMRTKVERTSRALDPHVGWTYRDPAAAREAIEQSLGRVSTRSGRSVAR